MAAMLTEVAAMVMIVAIEMEAEIVLVEMTVAEMVAVEMMVAVRTT